MADVITRFKVETTEYDKKISESKKKLKDFEKGHSDASKTLGEFADKMGLSTAKLGAMATAVAAAGAALAVAKDAFMASETNLDNWNRAIYAAKSTYETFLTAINTGDVSGFMSRINEVIAKANDAYNAMDRLGTQKSINNAAYQAQNVENERMRAMLRTGRYIAPNDGRSSGSLKTGDLLTDQQKSKIAKMLENGMSKVNLIVKDEIETTTAAIDALYEQQASTLGISKETFLQSTKTMADFDKAIAGYEKYKEFEDNHKVSTYQATSFAPLYDEQRDAAVNPYAQYKWAGVFKDDGALFTQINDLINQRASAQIQNYSNTANAYKSINKAEGGGTTGSSKTSKANKEQITNWINEANDATSQITQIWLQADSVIENGNKDLYDVLSSENPLSEWSEEADTFLDDVTNKMWNVTEATQEFSEKWKDLQDNIQSEAINETIGAFQTLGDAIGGTTGKVISYIAAMAEQVVQGIQTITSLKAEETALQAKAAAQGVSTLAAQTDAVAETTDAIATDVQTGAANRSATANTADASAKIMNAHSKIPFVGVAIGLGLVASLVGMMMSLPKFAMGGILDGNSFSGDTKLAAVNSGELILNRAQQGAIASQLQSANGRYELTTKLSGADILVSVNRTLAQGGKGNLVTTR